MQSDRFLVDSFEKWLAICIDRQLVRRIERTKDGAALWRKIENSGFTLLATPEDQGGAGAMPATIGDIARCCGSAALPVPLAFTLWAKGVFAINGINLPQGAISFANNVQYKNGSLICTQVPFAATSDYVLVRDADKTRLLPITKDARQTSWQQASLQSDLIWPDAHQGQVIALDYDWQKAGAALTTAMMAGAASEILAITCDYANMRQQFGRPISKFQAIQQQSSVLAEDVFALKMAADLTFQEPAFPHFSDIRVGMNKGRASEAVTRITKIAHGVVGAIGISDEFDLQLYTRRLYEWRRAFGSEAHWYSRVGYALLQQSNMSGNRPTALDFLLQHAPQTT